MPRKTKVKTKVICSSGHSFYKSSDCPICPICEKQKIPPPDFEMLSAPARRALDNAGINSIQALAAYSEEELLKLHGFGPASIPKLHKALQAAGLKFGS